MQVMRPNNNWRVISARESQIYTERWQRMYPLSAFLFHRNELACIQNETGSDGIRFYMALKEASEVDMVAVGVSSKIDLIGDSQNSKVYNFPMPCPSTCDVTSELYHNKNNKIDDVHCDLLYLKEPSSNCKEQLQEISIIDAFTWTLAWQKQYDIKSFLFDINQLHIAMRDTNASRVRIYFGLDTDDRVFAIMVGVDNRGYDVLKDVYQVNEISPCGKDEIMSNICDELSFLYHTV
ncbi:hypothetical protein [uncultured Dokdonia sp.]|uniref:hypothetical protein n=1 Tax=uncultured Dokdonia sp. TaxID=575653 RepID=UPI00262C9CC1|nr:hypothetical protein [uncultured Dokdonia sp.]